ncbi:uncharacterized SAM-binding protein YcdF (DUF218 family) [Hypnocyclicus thermotrophus]|uniref:Uncharacterized SAM-binding protein YcdF (DUF218 family) n=1 Tax=Hypnocyclicus thermotrophus TaxID=1627895 RepID=A0AA46DY30_9FUSO|nr:YdcF family protein [Hypnocyclicus thermotrophus]TDT69716.1 uncharacterized SAM-binding protein YcdF (DUF218 family) [Hypnocyclicus thermotrophus]
MGLILQKIIANIFLSPFLIILLIIPLFFIKKYKKHYIFILSIFIYIFSIEPTKDFVIKPLESKYPTITKKTELDNIDIYVVLGSGINDYAPLNFNTNGTPTRAALARIVESIRLYNISKKKIIFSGGIVFNGKISEAEIYKKIAIDLGVNTNDILIETKSKTTYENLKNIKEILNNYNYKKIGLITSAIHMNRAINSAKKLKLDILAFPCDYHSRYTSYNISSFIPSYDNMKYIRDAIWEYIGVIYYNLKSY